MLAVVEYTFADLPIGWLAIVCVSFSIQLVAILLKAINHLIHSMLCKFRATSTQGDAKFSIQLVAILLKAINHLIHSMLCKFRATSTQGDAKILLLDYHKKEMLQNPILPTSLSNL
uniref:Uncharacterized protein n=1 Tax=Glossina palpalis gambiensis TaxID=67801 RepID=A0A1B0BUP3_9MUSC